MKFRYKVVIVNIILLSIGIGIVGYFMIRKNFQLALSAQVKTAVEENNLLQATIEYRLLETINSSPSNLVYQMKNMSTDVVGKMGGEHAGVYVVYDGTIVASFDEIQESTCPEQLWKTAAVGKKQYIIQKSEDRYILYTCSTSLVQKKNMNIINGRDITETYQLVEKQRQYFVLLLLIVVTCCMVVVFTITYLLTKPLERLNQASEKFGKGDYKSRVSVKSHDEVGALADTYNQMADAVCEHMEQLHDMVTRQEQFVADFTHEVKTPMTTIIGYADMIRSKEMSRENQVIAASYIVHEGKRLELMAGKLFDFIYTRHRTIDLKPILVRGLMEEVEESVRPILTKKSQTLVCTCLDGKIYGDKNLLKSVFINIIDNARKASKEGSRILFYAEKTENGTRICVQDFGVGISEEHLQNICDAFYMVDKSRSREEGGAGLGLSLAASIVESHGEKLEIVSEVGKGTTMWVEFHDKKEKA